MLQDGAGVRINQCVRKLPDEDGAPCYQLENISAEDAKRLQRSVWVVLAGARHGRAHKKRDGLVDKVQEEFSDEVLERQVNGEEVVEGACGGGTERSDVWMERKGDINSKGMVERLTDEVQDSKSTRQGKCDRPTQRHNNKADIIESDSSADDVPEEEGKWQVVQAKPKKKSELCVYS